MRQHSKFTDGKVLRSKDATLTQPDLVVLRNSVEGLPHSAADLRVLDSVADKINDALEETAFFAAYSNAINSVDIEAAEKNIINDQAVAFLREQTIRPIMKQHRDALAPDVFLSVSDWSWLKRRWAERTNFGGDPDNRKRVLRIADAIEDALGYKNTADGVVIEGDDDNTPALRAV